MRRGWRGFYEPGKTPQHLQQSLCYRRITSTPPYTSIKGEVLQLLQIQYPTCSCFEVGVYRKYLRDPPLIKLEARAKSTRAGLWSSNNVIEPSDWRKSQRSRKPVSAANDGLSGPVKKSRSGICHAPGSTYYARTLNFKPFTTIDSCLTSGGRLPKR